MKFRLVPCIQCEKEKLEERYLIEDVELRDDLALDVSCPHGHKTLIVWEVQKFEILFQMGSLALLDGYYREAISSFAAAHERFHEFCIKIFLTSSDVKRDEFVGTWKLVSNQSERQLGAYYFLHLLYFNTAPPVNPKMIEFRNNVIHKGFIPSHSQASSYAEYVYDYIIEAVHRMRPKCNDAMETVIKTDLQEMQQSVPKGIMTKCVRLPTMIGLSLPVEKFGKRSFAQLLKDARDDHIQELRDRIDELEQDLEEDDKG